MLLAGALCIYLPRTEMTHDFYSNLTGTFTDFPMAVATLLQIVYLLKLSHLRFKDSFKVPTMKLSASSQY
jgi:hypothetical protein